MSITVSLATTEEQSEASAFIFADSSESEREMQIQEFLESIHSGKKDQHQILIARESGTLVGAGVLVFTDRSTAFFWPPFTRNQDCADAILQEMSTRIDRSDVSIGQSLLNPGQLNQRKILTRNGFPHLTDLLFMRHPLSQSSLTDSKETKTLEWVQYDEQQNHQRFLDLLDLTHQASHDCPVLNDIRTAEESLESHRSSGDSDQQHWYLFHREGIDLGVLLLSEHRADNVWEVVYMGVAPEQRGHGYGSAFIRHGLEQAQAQNQSGVILAVDHKNSYAIKIYEELGFVRQNTLSVHARLRSQFSEKKSDIN